MKFGLTEMLMVVVVVGIIIAVSVFFPAGGKKENEALLARKPRNAVEARDQQILRKRRSGFKLSGTIFIVIGILLILGAPGLIKAVVWSYLGGAIVIILGLAVFFISKRS
jgi:hypothetical protein